jgi:4-amino-4-deoxy-L-arabinose transferase-like glycosyltransferase
MLFAILLQAPIIVRDTIAAKQTSEALVQSASAIIFLMSIAGWIASYKFFKDGKDGKKYFFLNALIALIYLPFLVKHFFYCYKTNFSTGTEHYLLFFFLHAVILLFWSLGFYGKNKEEDPF